MAKRLRWAAAAFGIFTILAMLTAAPVLAHHRDGHDKGKSDDSGGGGGGNQNTSADPEPEESEGATRGPSCDPYDERSGPYDHDQCDSTQGKHGGGGNGKCAGCTGKADDKWPGGQSPGDGNRGYECDHNSGVGKGNPPHAKCPRASDDDDEVDIDTPPVLPPDVVLPDRVGPCDKNPNMPGIQPCDDVLGVRFSAGPREKVKAGVLPFTGAPLVPYVLMGLGLITSGGLLVRPRYRGKHL